MTREEAVRILDAVIPPPDHYMVDLDHLPIAQAWLCIKETLTAEPVKHAKWNMRRGEYYCSKCKKSVVPYRCIAQDGKSGYKEIFPDYCCWCGAKGEIGEDPSHPCADSIMMGD